MFLRLRGHLTFANVTLTLALVFAMTGGAFAARKYVITSPKQIKPSVLSKLKGAAGLQGPQGPAGPAGAAGLQGPAGTNGKDGVAGESVTVASLKKGEGGCAEGGSRFTVGGKEATACNGASGKEGPPGPVTEVLPSGKTLRGVWAAGGYAAGSAEGLASTGVSFAMSVEPSPTKHYIALGATLPAGCTGNSNEPGAEKGNLCIFATIEENLLASFANIDGSAERAIGFNIVAIGKEKGIMGIEGTWAVTAE